MKTLKGKDKQSFLARKEEVYSLIMEMGSLLSDLESQIREVLKRCLSYKIVEEVPVIKYQLETNCMFSYDKNGNIVPNPSKEWTGGDENGEMELPV